MRKSKPHTSLTNATILNQLLAQAPESFRSHHTVGSLLKASAVGKRVERSVTESRMRQVIINGANEARTKGNTFTQKEIEAIFASPDLRTKFIKLVREITNETPMHSV